MRHEVNFGLSVALNRVEYDRFWLPSDFRDGKLEELLAFLPEELRSMPKWAIKAMLPGIAPQVGGGVTARTTTFLTSTNASNQTWTVSADWNSANNVCHVIGGGASGTGRGAQGHGGGGGGGAYSRKANVTLTPSGSATFRLEAGITGGAYPGAAGKDAWFNGANLAASSVGAKGGSAGTSTDILSTCNGGAGGDAASGIGDTKYSGGAGAGAAAFTNNSGGGGGAAGPDGAGGAGTSAQPGVGGTGGNGSGGTAGANGTEFDASHGSGGGGAGGVSNGNAQAGGLYGGGGGGVVTTSSNSGGNGGQGLIVLVNN